MIARATRSARRWRNASALLLLAAGAACTPRQPPTGPSPEPGGPDAPGPVVPPAPPAAPPPVAPPPPASAVATPVRVGLVVDSPFVRVTSEGPFVVRTEEGREVARVQAGDIARFTRAAGGATLEVTTAGGAARGGARQGLSLPLVVQPQGGGVLGTGGNRYRGTLVVQPARAGSGLTLVNRLDMESYLLGVVPREIGRVGPELLEASKAQAVAARTYAVRYLGRRAQQGFDVYATVEDQVYGGVAGEHEPVSQAVRETAGEILAYNGEPITAYYHSTCAGQTAAIEEVWNERPAPYLVSVRDVDPATGEAFDRSSSRFTWTERWTHAQLVEILNRTLADSLGGRRIAQIREARVLERTPSGRVRVLRLETDAGTFSLGKDRIRWIFTPVRGGILNSSKFDVRLVREGGQVTEVVAEGGGWGHGIGMCQVGAMGRARAGQDYRTILRTYYPGTEIRKLY